MQEHLETLMEQHLSSDTFNVMQLIHYEDFLQCPPLQGVYS